MSNYDDLQMELDLSQLSQADLDGESGPPPGKYHVEITSVERKQGESPHLRVRMLVLAGTQPGSVGTQFSERFFLSDRAVKRLSILAHRLGLLPESALGRSVAINWAAAVGRRLIVEVIEEAFDKKDGTKGVSSKLSYAGFWGEDDTRHTAVPRGTPKPRTPAPLAAARPAPTPPPAQSAAPPTPMNADDFSNI